MYCNQKLLYDTLYHAAHQTMMELSADPKYLGAKIGYICVLHTWGSRLNYHPHLHMIVLGGGLDTANLWKARNLQNHYEFKELLDILYNRSDSYLPCKRLQEWWKIHPTYDQGNRLLVYDEK